MIIFFLHNLILPHFELFYTRVHTSSFPAQIVGKNDDGRKRIGGWAHSESKREHVKSLNVKKLPLCRTLNVELLQTSLPVCACKSVGIAFFVLFVWMLLFSVFFAPFAARRFGWLYGCCPVCHGVFNDADVNVRPCTVHVIHDVRTSKEAEKRIIIRLIVWFGSALLALTLQFN